MRDSSLSLDGEPVCERSMMVAFGIRVPLTD
jgi:hypothetical protein